MLLGTTSRSGRIEAPVVVKPDTVSKSASAKLAVVFVSMNGIAPKRLIIIQLSATITYPSFAYILFFFGGLICIKSPVPRQIAQQSANISTQSLSLYTAAQMSGRSMQAASKISTSPRVFFIALKFINQSSPTEEYRGCP